MKRIAILPEVRLSEFKNGTARPRWLAVMLVGGAHFAVLVAAVTAVDILIGNGLGLSGRLIALPLIVTGFIMEEKIYRSLEQTKSTEQRPPG